MRVGKLRQTLSGAGDLRKSYGGALDFEVQTDRAGCLCLSILLCDCSTSLVKHRRWQVSGAMPVHALTYLTHSRHTNPKP